MELSAKIVIIVLTALFFGSILWMAIYSRRTHSKDLPVNKTEP
jgi:hypothetical protein